MALNGLILMGVFALFAVWEVKGDPRAVFTAALLYGLSFGLHYLNCIYLPLLILFVLSSKNRSEILGVKPILMSGALFLMGLLQFVYMLVRPLGPPPYITTFNEYWDFNLGQQVEMLLDRSGGLEGVGLDRMMEVFSSSLKDEFGIPSIILAVFGFCVLWKHLPRAAIFLGLFFLLNRLSVVPFFDDPWAATSFNFFFIPSNIIVAILFGVSIYAILDGLQKFVVFTTRRLRTDNSVDPKVSTAFKLVGLGVAVSICFSVFTVERYNDHHSSQLEAKIWAADARVYSEGLLSNIPTDSVVLTDWTFGTPLWYYQEVEGLAPEVSVVSIFPENWVEYIIEADGKRPIFMTHVSPKLLSDLRVSKVLQYKWMTAYKTADASEYVLSHTSLVPIHPSVPINLSDKIAFHGCNLDPKTVVPGQSFRIEFYWEALVPMKRDYEVFVHFINSSGKLAFQQDHSPVGGAYPTSAWRTGEIIYESYIVVVSEDVPVDSYRIDLGIWDQEDGARFAVVGATKPQDAIELGELQVSKKHD